MIVFKDIITGDELFTDDNADRSPNFDKDSLFYEIECKMITKQSEEIDASAYGGNPSQEEEAEQLDQAAIEKGLDLIIKYDVEECAVVDSKKSLNSYFKKYLKSLAKRLQSDECHKKALGCFKENFKNPKEAMEKFTALFDDDCTVYIGKKYDPSECNATPMIGKWNDDGMGLVMYVLKDSVEQEKC